MAALLEVRDLVTEFGKGLGLLAVNGVPFRWKGARSSVSWGSPDRENP